VKLERIETAGRRHYITPIGNLPSVTTILKETQSARDREGLAFWRRKVGEAEANRVQADSAARGSRLHSMIETYLRDGTEGSGPWWDSVASVVRSVDRSRPFSVEESVYSPLGYAGSYDLLGYAGDDEALVDWKSARKRKLRSYVKDHEQQAAAYVKAVNTARHAAGSASFVRRAVIVVAYEDRAADVFPLDIADLTKAWREFSARLQTYQLRFGKVAQ
jgi:genome maintenance exonuclease 1